MKIKWPKFYSQIDLIELKKSLATQIKRIDIAIENANEANDVDGWIENVEYRGKLSKDLKKVKTRIAWINFVRSINNLIFGREEIINELDLFMKLSKSKHKKASFFTKLKAKGFNIENTIENLQKEKERITKLQNNRNNSFLSKSLLILTSQ